MVRLTTKQNDFSAGIIEKNYLGRDDLNIYANGVGNMYNMDILASGAIKKRVGTKNLNRIERNITTDIYASRIETFTSHDGRDFLIIFISADIKIVEVTKQGIIDRGFIYDGIIPYKRQLNPQNETIWEENPRYSRVMWSDYDIHELKITKGENYFMICHADHQPVLLLYSASRQRGGSDAFRRPPFVLRHWITDLDGTGRYKMPYSRFNVKASIGLKVTRARGRNGFDYFVESSEPLFDDAWKNSALRIKSGGNIMEVEPLIVINPSKIYCKVVAGDKNRLISSFTTDWSEAIFSGARGWPSVAVFHQGRLVLAGSRSFPKTIWMTKTGNYHDLDLGENSDDALDITLASVEAGDIRHLLSSKHLQIFTSTSEWVIADEVITPSQITLQKRTNIGIHERGSLPPLLVNGSSLFFDKYNNLHEYTYTSLDDNYVVNDLSHLTDNSKGYPFSLTYDFKTRRLFCPWENFPEAEDQLQATNDTYMKVLNLYQAEKITAWTQYKTQAGKFIDMASLQGRVFALCLRYYEYDERQYSDLYLEELTDSAKQDCETNFRQDETSLQRYLPTALQADEKTHIDTKDKIFGFYSTDELFDLNDSTKKELKLNDNFFASQFGSDETIFASFPIEVYIESLPPVIATSIPHSRYRILQAGFHLGEHLQFSVGIKDRINNINHNSDDRTYKALKPANYEKIKGTEWSNDLSNLIWKIHFSNRYDFTLYGVEMHLSVN